MEEPELVKFLVVEDDDLDFKMLMRTLKKLRINNPVIRAYDGIDALEILKGEHSVESISLPYIILLDINMPKMNGHDFLKELRCDENLKRSVVFILTTSAECSDLKAAYDRNVAGYILKNDASDSFLNAITMIDAYIHVVQVPCKGVV
ncbi:response regulator [Shewanella submarina]|uniref:Response regulator n=1 Tax=Shewanella submarina TaxID=2016376 RepID=A0ABV7GHI0_9GAMM|nr:response regulator [Shewanella submarina]MCL1038116.1 response regulator [Shewanella submarina]